MDFKLSDSFVEDYSRKHPDFGPLGLVTYKRTYARPIFNSEGTIERTEEWWETVQRVVEGTYTIQKQHCKRLRLPWNDHKAQKSAQEMYRLIFEMKFLPPGRGLWMMGSEYVTERGSAALNNCGFVSTKQINTDFSEPFCFLMDMSMLGVGVGGDTKGAGTVKIRQPHQADDVHVVPDSREGWVNLIRRLLDAWVGKGTLPKDIDYSLLRPYGAPIKSFGGTSSGPQALIELVGHIDVILKPLIGQPINSAAIVDLFNAIGRCVVSGNVRRSAEIMFGDTNDVDFLDLKNPDTNADKLNAWRWASNNSIYASIGQEYTEVANRTAKNGEPGYLWLKTAQNYGRLSDPADYKDVLAEGSNPCQPAWATVLTPDGIKTIGAVKIGDKIWSGQKFTVVTDKWMSGIKRVYAYHTRAGTFYGTENHRVVSEGVKMEVDQAENIDLACGPASIYFLPTCESELIDAQRYVMDGLVIGDGSVHKASGDLVGLHIGSKDQDYFKDRVHSLILEHRPGISDSFYVVATTIKPAELPKLPERKIPSRYKFANSRVKAFFLRGLFSANGSVVYKRVTLKSTNHTLITDVQEMLSSLGIRSYYTVNRAHSVQFSNGIYLCKTSYDLNISTDRVRFREIIGFIQEYKTDRLDKAIREIGTSKFSYSKPKTSYEIVSKTFISEEEVFDLTVEAPEHTYWTGGLLVSNCGEQTLESYELCCLVETFPSRHTNYVEYERTLKFAYLYAKTVTLLPTHNERANAVLLRNRRIGTSQSGIIQSFKKHGVRTHFEWCDNGYKYLRRLDDTYSRWLCVPKSIKITSVKPSGTVSLLPGATPGIHFPYSEYYWRTIRFDAGSELVAMLRKAGYRIEQGETPTTAIAYFPVKENDFFKSRTDVTLWEQLEIAAQMQAYWADNQVSVTVTFKPEEAKDIKQALEMYETRLKSVSFLPLDDHGYKHAPYQSMTRDEYEQAIKSLKPLRLKKSTETEGYKPKFCDGDICEIAPEIKA